MSWAPRPGSIFGERGGVEGVEDEKKKSYLYVKVLLESIRKCRQIVTNYSFIIYHSVNFIACFYTQTPIVFVSYQSRLTMHFFVVLIKQHCNMVRWKKKIFDFKLFVIEIFK